ncbi:MAG TPA: hypothetical protein VEY70_20650 [Metabacillus sp.]|nr:hypothetical protein [Metabacillus sp.]
MTEALSGELYNSYRSMKKMLRDFSVSQHQNERYISTLLMELVTLTRTAITMLQQDTVAKRRFRQAIATLYRSYTDFERAFHEWAINAKFHNTINFQWMFQMEMEAKSIDRHLTIAIREMGKLYSNVELRGMVPDRYRERI